MVVSSICLFGMPITWQFNQHALPGNVSALIEFNALSRKSAGGGAGNIRSGDALPKVCAFLPVDSGVP
jgi:hypothetical protein